MLQLLSEILPLALAIVASAAPIIAVVVLMMGDNGLFKAFTFVTGWFLGSLIVLSAALLLGLAAPEDPAVWSFWLKVVLGLLLLVLAVQKIRAQSAQDLDGAPPEEPAWMAGLTGISGGKSLLLGATLSGANPKNLALGLAAGSTIVVSGVSEAEQWTVAIIFAVIASLGLLVPFIGYLIRGEKADARLEQLKSWMTRNSDGIAIVILIIFGLKLLVDGVAGLIG